MILVLSLGLTACATNANVNGRNSQVNPQANPPQANPPQTIEQQEVTKQPTDKKAIRPFRVNVPEEELTELRRRIEATKWPEKETVSDKSQGVQLATIQKLAQYWLTEYDWRKIEAKMNSYPQFITEIDGLDIHFMHVRSKHKGALPIIITHGWPGSIIEQMKIIDPLTNPTKYGGKASDAFDVVIPSIPGFGYSGKPTTTGWDPVRMARAWAVLMKRLGYKKYVAQGGDWGSLVTDLMGKQEPPGLLAIHSNLPAVVPPEVIKAIKAGSPQPDLSEEEKTAVAGIGFTFKYLDYAHIMGSRPQTLTGLADSPVGLAAFMLDHDPKSLALISRAFDGQKEGLTRDDVLDNITLFWLTNTAISSARIYWENKTPFFLPVGVKIPAAVSVFPDELFQAPKSWAKKAYPNLIYYNKLKKGGHFAAWEQPMLFVKELRAAFKSVR
ncbi:epoxide hydrolase [Cohnella luojiensis]|uniref:Epoxide hydrolase n=2 Tax=Cohnella luojiensis TaxID=652876 RepID=A0A4Y8M141_9BACL|nr:epoxide hydrolase [Cohnella luojiensis]